MLGLMAKLIFWDFESGEVKEVDNHCEDYEDDYDVDEGFDFCETESRDSFDVSSKHLSSLSLIFHMIPFQPRVSLYMSPITRKPVFGVCDRVILKTAQL